jgi:hypothetical protein
MDVAGRKDDFDFEIIVDGNRVGRVHIASMKPAQSILPILGEIDSDPLLARFSDHEADPFRLQVRVVRMAVFQSDRAGTAPLQRELKRLHEMCVGNLEPLRPKVERAIEMVGRVKQGEG